MAGIKYSIMTLAEEIIINLIEQKHEDRLIKYKSKDGNKLEMDKCYNDQLISSRIMSIEGNILNQELRKRRKRETIEIISTIIMIILNQ